MKNNTSLKNLPSVNDIKLNALKHSQNLDEFILTNAIRQTLDEYRKEYADGKAGKHCSPLQDKKTLIPIITIEALKNYKKLSQNNLRPVINATGIILHTNLGRAPMPSAAAENAALVAQNYSTLEYNLGSGERGSRYSHIEELISKLTGAESALVVNNNAAAVLLILSALVVGTPKAASPTISSTNGSCIVEDAEGGVPSEIIVSRGELVEIGGSFRIPDIMELGGAILKEVGTTNKTKLSDYEKAINKKTAAILKVHTSNYKVVGFSEEVDITALSKLAQKHKLPLIYDFGSGFLDEYEPKLLDEPPVLHAIKNGADLICFSGDKLLGGPQCGIIAGKKELVDMIKKHQLTRVLRVDKLCLAALEPLLRIYAADKDRAKSEIPVLRMLSSGKDELKGRAEKLYKLSMQAIADDRGQPPLQIKVVELDSQVGGGSAPTLNLASFGIEIKSSKLKANEVEKILRDFDVPIIARIKNDCILMDVRTIFDSQFDLIVNALKSMLF